MDKRVRTPEQIIGKDALVQLIFEGYAITPARVETIAGAAMRVGDIVISMKPPARHHTILHEMDRLGIDPFVAPDDQGFITSSGRFVDRHEGCVIALARGQITVKTGPADVLFSEDMW